MYTVSIFVDIRENGIKTFDISGFVGSSDVSKIS